MLNRRFGGLAGARARRCLRGDIERVAVVRHPLDSGDRASLPSRATDHHWSQSTGTSRARRATRSGGVQNGPGVRQKPGCREPVFGPLV